MEWQLGRAVWERSSGSPERNCSHSARDAAAPTSVNEGEEGEMNLARGNQIHCAWEKPKQEPIEIKPNWTLLLRSHILRLFSVATVECSVCLSPASVCTKVYETLHFLQLNLNWFCNSSSGCVATMYFTMAIKWILPFGWTNTALSAILYHRTAPIIICVKF